MARAARRGRPRRPAEVRRSAAGSGPGQSTCVGTEADICVVGCAEEGAVVRVCRLSKASPFLSDSKFERYRGGDRIGLF